MSSLLTLPGRVSALSLLALADSGSISRVANSLEKLGLTDFNDETTLDASGGAGPHITLAVFHREAGEARLKQLISLAGEWQEVLTADSNRGVLPLYFFCSEFLLCPGRLHLLVERIPDEEQRKQRQVIDSLEALAKDTPWLHPDKSPAAPHLTVSRSVPPNVLPRRILAPTLRITCPELALVVATGEPYTITAEYRFGGKSDC